MAEMPTDNVGRNLARDWAHGMAGQKRGGGLLLDALLPPQCLCCGEMVDRQGNLCAPCWSVHAVSGTALLPGLRVSLSPL